MAPALTAFLHRGGPAAPRRDGHRSLVDSVIAAVTQARLARTPARASQPQRLQALRLRVAGAIDRL